MAAVTPAPPRRRDAAATRALLLDAARRRFARGGYAATTVREIADDAGVNVALINRYFGSKEGLFEACLAAAVEDLGRTGAEVSGPNRIQTIMARHLTSVTGADDPSRLHLMLLVRTSGDKRAEQMRLGVLRRFSEGLASTAGWQPDDPGADQILLRAQLMLAASVGIVLLRSTTRLEPLVSATEDDIAAPLRDLMDALLGGG